MTTENATAATATETKPAIVKFVPQSDKLTDLRKQYKAALIGLAGIDDPFSDDGKTAKLAMLKIDGEIKAEENELTKAHNDAIAAEAKNARLKLVTDLLDAQKAVLTAPKNTSADEKAKLDAALQTALDIVNTEMLAKYGTSKPASSNSGEATAPRSTANTEQILSLARAGKSHKEIEAETGIPRSTVWHTINKAKQAGETFPVA